MHLRQAQSQSWPELGLPQALAGQLIQAARSSGSICGLTHNFYRYPARFSPALVRAAIRAFTKPGDLILDPFVGGGTKTGVRVEFSVGLPLLAGAFAFVLPHKASL